MKRGFHSLVGNDAGGGGSTPQLLKQTKHRRSGSGGAPAPAKRGKATSSVSQGKGGKQLSLHQFLNPVPTPRTQETPTLLANHKSVVKGRGSFDGSSGAGTDTGAWNSAQRAFEAFKLGTPPAQQDACPLSVEPRHTSDSLSLAATLSRPSSAESSADGFRLFCSQTYQRQSPQQPEDSGLSRSDSGEDEEQRISWSGIAGGFDNGMQFPMDTDIQVLPTQQALPSAPLPPTNFSDFSFLEDFDEQPATQPADEPINIEDETCCLATIKPNQAGATNAATPELVPTQINASCSTAGVALDENTHGAAHLEAPLFNIFRPAKDRKCLLIIRHGESEYNRACSESKGYADPHIFDPCLTAKGRSQCLDLKRRLQHIISEKMLKFGDPLFVVSPLTRTLQTFLESNPFPERLARANAGDGGDPALEPLNVEVLPAISEFMVTPGDVGRPPAELARDFPQLAKQLLQLPEVWWYQDPQQPNCALSQCWGSSEPQKAREHRISEFARWLNGRHEQLVVLVGHSSFWHHFTNKSRQRLQNCEVMSMTW